MATGSQYRWDWHIFAAPSPEGTGTYGDMLVQGLQATLLLTVSTVGLSVVVGTAVGILRSWPDRRAWHFARLWIDLFRGVPLLVQLFLWYFVFPEVVPDRIGGWLKQAPSAPFATAVVAIGLFMSTRIAVLLAASIAALPKGQQDAALALGLERGQAYRFVVLPRAFRNILPALTSEILNTAKNTSVALTIGVAELTARARAIQEFSFQVFEPYAVATACYLLINILITFAMRRLEHRLRLPGFKSA